MAKLPIYVLPPEKPDIGFDIVFNTIIIISFYYTATNDYKFYFYMFFIIWIGFIAIGIIKKLRNDVPRLQIFDEFIIINDGTLKSLRVLPMTEIKNIILNKYHSLIIETTDNQKISVSVSKTYRQSCSDFVREFQENLKPAT